MKPSLFAKHRIQKMIIVVFVAILCLTFQNPQDGQFGSLYVDCLNNGDSPKGSLEVIDACMNKKIGDGEKGHTLVKIPSSGEFNVINPDGTSSKTWYSEKIDNELGGNNLVRQLAIARPNLDIIIDEANKALVFGGEFNGKYSIWVWKPDINNKARELSFIDFVAGEQATKEFMQFLKQNNGKQYKQSRLQEMVKNWAANPSLEYKVIAVLSNNCVQPNSIGKQKDCTDYANTPKEVFKWDNVKDRPKCLSYAISNVNSNARLNFLVQVKWKSHNYEVWSQSANTPAPFYLRHEAKNNKYIAWLTILCFACREELADFRNSIGDLFSVYACDNYILCVNENGTQLYSPVKLIDDTRQTDFVNYLKSDPNIYKNSIVHQLVKEWANNPSVKYIIKAFGDKSLYNYPGDATDLSDYLERTNTRSFTGNFSLLLKKVNDGSYYFRNSIASSGDLSWFSEIHPSDTTNLWLAQLAALDNKVLLLDDKSPGRYSFITSHPKDYLRAWKLNSSNKPTEYAPLKNLYDNSSSIDFASAFATAIRGHENDLFDIHLQGVIADYFSHGGIEVKKIRQIYPNTVHVPRSGYAPLTLLESTSTSEIPPPLERAFDNGNRLQYLIEENGDFHIYGNSRVAPSDIVWFQEVHNFNDTWLAWLCLADPTIKVVKSAGTGSPTRLCMISGEDRENLWSWVATNSTSPNPPAQYPLVKGTETFELSGNPMGGYIKGLYDQPGNTSQDERLFFLEKADAPQTFILSDFLDYPIGSPGRVLLWHTNPANAKTLLRVGVKPDFNSDEIKINLVEGVSGIDIWKQIAERYRQQWCGDKFMEKIARSTEPNLEAWFGKERLGLAKGTTVGVFLPENCGIYKCRDFDFTNFSAIEGKVDDLIYIPNNSPNKNTFFQSWVATKWDTTIWRANPLGYFDRVNL